MGREIFVAYPPVYAHVEPYYVASPIYAYYAPTPIEVATVRPKAYGPYGPYTYGPY